MGIVSHENEVATAIPPAKMFKVFVLDADNTIPKILPQAIKSIEIIEGNGGPGTIKKTTFAEGSEVKYIKHKTEAIDQDHFIYNYSAIGGDPWMDTLDKISYETKMVPSPDGGSICKSITKYYPKGDSQIDVDQIKAAEEKALGMFKVVEAYILANPDAFN
ncbi:major allergen Pru ar 1 [Ricinus communis]|uniref:Major allergen Pru ar, putative n=1 Tax=Ricinus communis TaxID=3988 RepID=B9RTC5_RICCO|nr:major allergen Pru ar 1 [Ricinus communis]EEF45608.1 Major allergen Pru ar, putative [Ricinus communis]|eukprot:XP_002516994.1 major allergen Pru ar 1 [Ricinus communis]